MISIVIADDHIMFREGIVSMLESEPNFQFLGQASNGEEAIALIKKSPPDILILDLEMPIMDGFDTMRALKTLAVKTKVLILTMHKSAEFIKNILKAGADGYLQKDANKAMLVSAVNELFEKGTYFSSATSKIVLESFQEKKVNAQISAREKEIIKLIADGLTTKAIASELHISKHTVESHRQNILLKLNLNNTAALVKYAIQHGLI